MSDYNINGLAIPLFLIFMAMEFLYLRLCGRSLHRYNDSVTSLSMGLCLLISDALLKAYTFTVFIYLWQHHRLFDFAATDLITWVVFFFGVDFCYYWFHRCAHEINILWGTHVGHHQSEEYNLTTALRQSAFQYAFSWVFYLPLAILGCPPQVFLVQFIILKLYQFWLHTQAIYRIPGLEGFFSTPSSHRVHHAKNPVYIDRNYGGTLVIWDRLFGTWQPELKQEACHYGTTRPLDTFNPIKANLQHWNMLLKDTLHTRSLRDKFSLWFQPTGWRPNDCLSLEHDTSAMQKDGCRDRQKYDPPTSKLNKIYAGIIMLSLFLLSTLFLFLTPSLVFWQLTLGSCLIILGLVVANDLLESKTTYLKFEVVRWPLTIWFSVTLWFTPSTTIVIDTIAMSVPASQSLNYAASVEKWPEWHPQSLKVYAPRSNTLIKDELFEEDITTPIGPQHLKWNITKYEPNQIWQAEAINQNNGTHILLTYEVSETDTGSRFKRTLSYTVPNVFLTAFNVLIFKNKVEVKSEEALLNLRNVLEKRFKD
ncbi:MAG: sterol desaturase family protein [Gammaproteobacteria bacterium]|nr:sterol desaturase family protein [Gammaproteobacteria bacterium]